MDVKTAFLNGVLKEETYMNPPEGLNQNNQVCKLKKAIYGLKQSPRCWNQKFDEVIKLVGFKRSSNDFCLYHNQEEEVYLLIYVDDVLICGKNLRKIEDVKKKLMKKFCMKDLGEINCFLGIKIERSIEKQEMFLNQKEYLLKVLKRFEMSECNPISTPMEPNLKLTENTGESTTKPFREMAGCMMYAALCTRPDILYPVRYLCEFQSNPSEEHWKCLKRILRYIKGTLDKKLVFKDSKEIMYVFSDSDYANNLNDRKSVSGYSIEVFGCLVSWSSKKQNCVTLSSTEAEYVALCHSVTEALWISYVFKDIGFKLKEIYPINIFEDNKSCIISAEEPKGHNRMKHIDVRYHFVREKIAENKLKLIFIKSEDQKADILTKPLPRIKFEKLVLQLNLN